MTAIFRINNMRITTPGCNILLVLLLLMLHNHASAQKDSTKRVSIFPFPVVYYAPETRFVFGAGGTMTFRFKRDSLNAKPSNIIFGAAYTQNKQVLVYLPFKIFYNDNRYYFFGEVGYYKYSFYFFGLSTNEVPQELYHIDLPRIRLNATYQILPNIYAGVKYQYDNYDITKREAGGELDNGTIPGWDGSIISGAGIEAIYDSRDYILYPGKGMYGEVNFVKNGSTWGGNFNFNRVIIDWATYHTLGKRAILAMNSYNSFVTGNAPFQQQSVLGGNKKMRGYYEGRYIDMHQVALQAELRMNVYKRLGAVVFTNAAMLGNQANFLRTDDVKYTAGAGIRYTINKKDKLNIRLDYARGPGTSGVYFTVGEAF